MMEWFCGGCEVCRVGLPYREWLQNLNIESPANNEISTVIISHFEIHAIDKCHGRHGVPMHVIPSEYGAIWCHTLTDTAYSVLEHK